MIPKELFGKELEVEAYGTWQGTLKKVSGTFMLLTNAYIVERKDSDFLVSSKSDDISYKFVGTIWLELNTIETIRVLQTDILRPIGLKQYHDKISIGQKALKP